MTKILFVSTNLSSSFHGGWQCSNRNLESVRTIFGADNVDVELLEPFSHNHRPIFSSILMMLSSFFRLILTFRMNGSNLGIENKIITRIAQNKYKFVFVDSSLNGLLVKKIRKRTESRIVSFFHNCEYAFIKSLVNSGDIKSVLRLLPCYLNEKFSVKYAHKVIALNTRDKSLIEELYKVNKTVDIIPISLFDRVSDESSLVSNKLPSKLSVLFVGSNFYANTQGILWFINEVFPFVDIDLKIVGKDMDKLIIPHQDNILVYGTVPSVEQFYIDADLVVAPVFAGGGMKVKIAEALMYGKVIIASEEALQGYQLVDSMVECKTSKDFIEAFAKFDLSGYNVESRNLFKKTYSFEATLLEFKKIFILENN
ncbi:glycosyltransferase [Dysgonomonas sp. GY617]|uniref:glycosyltransferase n=1 Tax=Dysgonomonas sp. GY617 TaxID=2780420 RepID=UPI001883984F|nr:glycosyltransferase [Dysgonomonas sp. GY617]MBF0576523.1 glycosyltransferase [Dysgonomonas sp. GY617]